MRFRGAGEVRFPKGIAVRASAYCSATQVHFDGRLDGESLRNCGRCLDDFVEPLQRRFRLVVVESGSSSDDPNDPGVDRHDGRELDAGALVEEQALLALEGDGAVFAGVSGVVPAVRGESESRDLLLCGSTVIQNRLELNDASSQETDV